MKRKSNLCVPKFLLLMILVSPVPGVLAGGGCIVVSGSMVVAPLWDNGVAVGLDMDQGNAIKWRMDTGRPRIKVEAVDESQVVLWTNYEILIVQSKTGKILTKIVPKMDTNAAICDVSILSGGRVVSLLRHERLDAELQCHSLSSGEVIWKQNFALDNENVFLQACGNIIGLAFCPVTYMEDGDGVLSTRGVETGWKILSGKDGSVRFPPILGQVAKRGF